MNVTSLRTHRITANDTNIVAILDRYFPKLKERSVVAVTSKVVAICEGRLVPIDSVDKDELIKKEAQYYLPRTSSKYNVCLTIARNILAASAGIDESNGKGSYVLWPKDPQKSANEIRDHLRSKFSLKYVGVVLTDSKTTPLRWGVTGFSLAYSGFAAIKNYIGKRDLFGRTFEYEKVNVADSLAAAAVVAMGEGAEQTPIAVIEDLPFVTFQNRNPSKRELEELRIALEDDLYAPLLCSVSWRKGGLGKKTPEEYARKLLSIKGDWFSPQGDCKE